MFSLMGKTADAKKILSQADYLAAHRGADASTIGYADDVRRSVREGRLDMARQYLKDAVRAWEESTGYTVRRGELAAWASAA